jgi:low affinity Fe/Cu permease
VRRESGPFFNFSDTWQLIINTGTTIITFLMVFLIQNTQTRDTLALQVKLSELIIAHVGARNLIAEVDDKSEEELEKLKPDIQHKAEEQEQPSRRGEATHRVGENRGE